MCVYAYVCVPYMYMFYINILYTMNFLDNILFKVNKTLNALVFIYSCPIIITHNLYSQYLKSFTDIQLGEDYRSPLILAEFVVSV